MANAAKISIAIEAQTAQLQRGFSEAKAEIKSFSAGMSNNVAMGMAKAHVAMAAVTAVVGTLQGTFQNVMRTMDEMGQLEEFAQRLGMSSDALTVLGYAAEQTGASQETMNGALQKMQNLIGEAAAGSDTAAAAFGQLGLQVSALKNLDPDQAFAAIAEQMQQVESSTDRTKIALDIFGKSGGELNILLAEGAEGLNKYGQEAEHMGLLMGKARGAVEAAGDAVGRMKKAWHSMWEHITAFFAPAIEAVSNAISSVVSGMNRLFGRTTGNAAPFQEYETQAKQATVHIEKSLKSTEKTATKAAAKIKEAWRDIPKPADWTTPGVGAVTAASAAGFSAVQEATRARQDADRRHRDLLAWLGKIYEAQRRSQITLQPVNI